MGLNRFGGSVVDDRQFFLKFLCGLAYRYGIMVLLWLSWPGKCAHINQNIGKQSVTTDSFMLLHRPLGG